MAKLTNENILLASLLGSKAVEQLPRFEAVQNEMAKHVLPPVRFLPLQTEPDHIRYPDYALQNEDDLWRNDKRKNKDEQFFPFSFSADGKNWWLLPWEPMISIESKTRMSERYVAKSGSKFIGSIKEIWATDDYDITITGAFYGDKMTGKAAQTYPREDMEKLRDFMLKPMALHVNSEPLQILGINYIVIQSVSFPFSKGENVQAYEIKAVSDFPWKLTYDRQQAKTPNLQVGDLIPEGVER